jgi:outer membrane protein TolC
VQLTTAGYRAGEFPFNNVLISQRTLFTARVNQVEALGKLQMSYSEIDGLLLSGSLNSQ